MGKKESRMAATETQGSEQVRRISHYEALYDKISRRTRSVSRAIESFKKAESDIRELAEYYASDAWKTDFADDEAGRLPKELKRGVLSEDGVFNLLDEVQMISEMLGDK